MKRIFFGLIIAIASFALYASFGIVNKNFNNALAAPCTYSFSPRSLPTGGTITVTVSSSSTLHGFEVGITSNPVVKKNFLGPQTETLIAPAAGNYVLYATDTTDSNLCSLTSGTSALEVTATQPPPGACTYNFAPKSAGVDETIIFTIFTGTAGHVFTGEIVRTTGGIVNSSSLPGTPSSSFNIAVTATEQGTFIAAALDENTSTLCAITSGSSELKVSAGGGTYTAVINTAGCTGSLACVVTTSPTLNTTNHTFTGLTGGTKYDVYVCSPDCGTGTALGNFNPKSCIAKSDGTLYVDWLTNVCDGDLPPYTGTGGAGCEGGFLACLTQIESPTTAFSETGLVGAVFSSILPIIIGLGGFLTVILIVVSGIQFVTSSGNPEAAAAARGRLTFAIIGFALLVLAFAITQIVDNVFLRGSGVF